MRRSRISQKDIEESIRLNINTGSFEEVEEVIVERSGELSVIKKK